jgi:uncharacterized protein YbjT (DUF2867 family)
MKILLTGATGYIGKRLIPLLLGSGHHIVCCVRDKRRFDISGYTEGKIEVIEADFLNKASLSYIPYDIDVAYYLIHSMASSVTNFDELEKISASNFVEQLNKTSIRQVIYLSGIINSRELSRHLSSRKAVEEILSKGKYQLTTLRAGIIVGSGSASFEIIRDLVEKLPVMIAPNWLNTRSQPIAIRNVLHYLTGVLALEKTYGNSFDIGGPEILTYKEMLLQFAEVRNLKRFIFVVPVMTPRLSSYWLYFITSTSYKLAINLVNSMKVEVICGPNNLHKLLPIYLISYRDAVNQAFDKIEQDGVVSSWKDALTGDVLLHGISRHLEIPAYGCFTNVKRMPVMDESMIIDRIWSIGGKTGWYYGDWLWELRGFIDKLFGGVGLRRGRKSNTELYPGDALDFWRVLVADKENRRLLLYAEMKLPGEAWLEFVIKDGMLIQTATFRPLGIWGRMYWYSLIVLHAFVFRGMIRNIAG